MSVVVAISCSQYFLIGLCEGDDNLVVVAFCARVRAKKIQEFLFEQAFGHCYCILTAGPALFLAYIYLMWLRFFFFCSIILLFLFRFYDTK